MSFGPLNAGNISQFNGQVEQLIRQIIQTESKPVQQLQEKKTALEKQQEIFDQASSTIAGLQSKAESLPSVFDQRVAASSNPSIVGVSAGVGARPGSYDLTVEELAKAHTLASHRIPAKGGNVGKLLGPGERRFNIIVHGQRVEIRFDIPEVMEDGNPPTNEDILRIIARAVRQADAEAGLSSQGFTANTVRDTSTTARLIVKSELTGSANQLQFEDPEGVLQLLGINPGTKATEESGGYINGPEGENKIREQAANLFNPIADLSDENIPAVADTLNSLAGFASRLAEGEGLPLAQSLANLANILTDDSDITDNGALDLAFESLADLVDRMDTTGTNALAKEFLRRAGELRSPSVEHGPLGGPQTEPLATGPAPGTLQGEKQALADALDRLASGIQQTGQGQDALEAFQPFRDALKKLTTQDRASLLNEFGNVLNRVNALGRVGGDQLTDSFAEMVQPLFDLTIDERTSAAIEFLNIADIAEGLGSQTAQRAAAEFRDLGDLVEAMSQPLSDPLETPYAAIYSVFYVLPPDTKNKLAVELNHYAAQLEGAGQADVAEGFRTMAEAVSDPDIQNNFTSHFNDFATVIGSMNRENRERFRDELAAFNSQISQLIPPGQAQLLYPNFQTVVRSIDELNAFQQTAFTDQMIAITEALDQLTTKDRGVIREEMMKSLKHLRNALPIRTPEGLEEPFAAFNGAANDLTQEDRNILAAELARAASEKSDQALVAKVFDVLSSATFDAGQPGSFDAHKQDVIWYLSTLNEQERQELASGMNEVADRLPGLIGEDAAKFIPAMRDLADKMAQPVVFETSAGQFLNGFADAAAATGTFDDEQLLEINRYLPELAQVLADNVTDRHQNLAQNVFMAGQSLAHLSPASQDAIKAVIQQIAPQLNAVLTGQDGARLNEALNSLTQAIDEADTLGGLDARFTLDGVPIIRSTNTVSDLLDGLTFNLQNTTDPSSPNRDNRVVRINIDNDTENIQKGVQDFIDAYNQTIDFVDKETHIDGETGDRGALAGDQDYLRLRLNMRQAINSPIDLGDGPLFLRDIGIGIGTGVSDSDHLQITDPEALQRAIAENPDLIKALFGDPNGAASRVIDLADSYLNPNGFISKDKALIDRNVGRIDDRIGTLNDRLSSREGLLRNQFNGIADQLISLGSQTQALQGMGSGLAF